MPQNQAKLNISQPIVNPDGTPSQHFQLFLLQLANSVTIVSTGNPEAVLEAQQYCVYVDETVPAAPVTYRKMLPEIGGDRKKGWVVI